MNYLRIVKPKNLKKISDYKGILLEIKFQKKVITKINSGGIIKSYVLIVVENIKTGIYKPTIFSNFFNNYKDNFNNELLNKALNTKLNYANVVVNFLNYVFIDNFNKYKLNNINNIKIDMGNEFLKDYAYGKVSGKGIKSNDVINDVNSKLSKFYLYLYEEFNLKHIDEKEFRVVNVGKYIGNNKRLIGNIKNLFLIDNPNKEKPKKINQITSGILGELFRVTNELHPEIALGLAFQAFGGLRAGEVCSLTTYAVNYYIESERISWFELDLRREYPLSEDNQIMGHIKKKRIQPIHPAFMEIIDFLYNRHLKLNEGYNNSFGGLFLNNRGGAMSQRSYYYRFSKIKDILINRLSASENIYKRSQANLLMSAKFSPHVLRYYFSQFLASVPETNANKIAYWRGDSSLDSSIRYIIDSPDINDKIKQTQEEMAKIIFGGEYDG